MIGFSCLPAEHHLQRITFFYQHLQIYGHGGCVLLLRVTADISSLTVNK